MVSNPGRDFKNPIYLSCLQSMSFPNAFKFIILHILQPIINCSTDFEEPF